MRAGGRARRPRSLNTPCVPTGQRVQEELWPEKHGPGRSTGDPVPAGREAAGGARGAQGGRPAFPAGLREPRAQGASGRALPVPRTTVLQRWNVSAASKPASPS